MSLDTTSNDSTDVKTCPNPAISSEMFDKMLKFVRSMAPPLLSDEELDELSTQYLMKMKDL
ncbi:MAG: hypothetical protein EOP45_15690 [Sphingobacteriaceae bacterium]|nr:MAG: hypothetical protein EOP45_15690 [Sphingobacteriaceae bacterium]